MRHAVLSALLVALLAAGLAAQNKPSQTKADQPKGPQPQTADVSSSSGDSSSRLPVKRVVLYKNGVGYFEHTARVHGTQDLSIDFTTGQLNDVLKSLTAVDLGDGRVSSVRYNSIAPLDERLKSLRLPFGEQVTQAEYLSALRGARVEVRSGSATATGRLLSVEKERRQRGKDDYEDVTTFAVVTDAGEMRNFDLGPGTSVRIAERELTDEVGRYLSLLGSSRARDVRRMSFTAAGSGDRDVFVSYISEVPVWKSTYRILFPEKPGEKPLLQGWAIVDNTIGEDWKDVELSLVAGAPQSFVQNISQPFYARRPEVPLPESVMLTPQSHEATEKEYDRLEQFGKLAPPPPPGGSHATTSLSGVVKDPAGAVVSGARVTVRNEETGVSQMAMSDTQGRYRFTDVQAGNSAVFVAATGFQRFNLSNVYLGIGRNNEIDATLSVGGTAETVEVQASSVAVNTTNSTLIGTVEKEGAEAEGKSAGDYFEYKIKQKITIGKNQSALVPILQGHIDAEKVTLWNPESAPLRALWIKNTSGQVLDAGSFNVLEAETFAGEGVLETIHPDERRLLSYAGDAAVHVKYSDESSERPFSHVKIVNGVMVMTQEQHKTNKYTIRNADTEPRQVIVEYAAEEGWKLAPGTTQPEESTESFHRFRVPVAAGKTAELTVEAVHPEESRVELSNLGEDDVKVLVEQKRVTPAMQQAFDRILKQQVKIGDITTQINDRKGESDQIATDQNRIRENMKALKGSSEEKTLLQRYVGQLDAQENRLAALRKETADLTAQDNAAKAELDRMIMDVNLDEAF
ncbi:MAG TPA: carboxypeptidase regulatory-like domain-containing protein [Candidatus Sulfotelmatobacter sp.]|nr:carboxypeptidase regulatory-like domain-containing protein [Candidatus Sulfotelmatobacter sp.]